MSEKLIRDNIPTIALLEGRALNIRSAKRDELEFLFKTKIIEEANEVFNASNRNDLVEELADLQQVIKDMITQLNLGENTTTSVRLAKEKARGSFSQSIVLITKEEVNG